MKITAMSIMITSLQQVAGHCKEIEQFQDLVTPIKKNKTSH